MRRPLSSSSSLPRWGRVGVGARAFAHAQTLPALRAPIPAFPQRGKEPQP
jgi:hypothetical protein